MRCEKLQSILPDVVLCDDHVPADVRQHLEECAECQTEWKELRSTMRLLDLWEAPEPSPYFDTRMAGLLREARNSPRPGWLERLRARLLFDSNFRMRPALAAGLALAMVAGAGAYEGFVILNRTAPPQRTVSATVTDLELLDSNAQTLQQLAAFDDTDVSRTRAGNGKMSN